MNALVDPLDYYFLPPIEGFGRRVGDVLQGLACERDGYWVVLTPSCDFEQRKAEHALLAACEPLDQAAEYTTWKGAPAGSAMRKTATKRLRQLFRNNREKTPDRFYYLPSLGDLPHLIVDYQQTHAVPKQAMDALTAVATLRHPFDGAVVGQFVRYFGRVGTPDLDFEKLIGALA